MQPIDHIVAGAIVLISVVQAFANPEVLKQAPRLAFFKAGAATGLLLGVLVLLLWHVSDHSIAKFGLFGWAGSQPLVTALLALVWPLILAAVAGLLLARVRSETTRFYAGYGHLMPRNRRELPAAYGAGSFGAFGEEIAYRGFLLWYLHALTGLTVATLASSLIFGIAHGYQGRLGMAFATLAGLVLAGAYIASGSLLLALWMHASYNIASFTLGYRLLYAPRSGGVDRAGAPLQSGPAPNPSEFDR